MRSLEAVRELMAQGCSFDEAVRGKNWREKYPNLARWEGGAALNGSGQKWRVSLQIHVGPWPHATHYNLVERKVSTSDPHQALDELVKDWLEQEGEAEFHRFKAGWRHENWEQQYPHIAAWMARGKRFCFQIKIDFVAGNSKGKAWFYDKPANRETVLFEGETASVDEAEILRLLNKGIELWLFNHDWPNVQEETI